MMMMLFSYAVQIMLSIFLFHQLMKPRLHFMLIFGLWITEKAGTEILSTHYPMIPDWIITAMDVLILFLVTFLYKSGIRQKVTALLIYFIISITGEQGVLLILCQLFQKPYSALVQVEITNIIFDVGRLIMGDIMMMEVMIICFVNFYRQRLDRFLFRNLAIFSIFPVLHFGFLCWYFYVRKEILTEFDTLVITMLQLLMFSLLIIQYYNSQRTCQLLKNQQELRSMQSRLKQEQNYYLLADEKFTEISKLRHDIQNQLQTVRFLMHSPETQEQAVHIMDRIQENLDAIKVVNFCPNHTINAVLTIKINDARSKNIRTSIVIRDCENLPFDELDVCSLLSNLFDNAMESCLKCKDVSGTFIDIRGGVRKGYYVLRMMNSSASSTLSLNSQKPGTGHGYGTVIIDQICRKYNGSFQLAAEDGCVSATSILSLDSDFR